MKDEWIFYSKEVRRLPLLITHLVPKDERSLAGAGEKGLLDIIKVSMTWKTY
jgi:hypothetical protein